MEKRTIRIISYIIAIVVVIITLVIFAFMGLNIYYYGDTRIMLQFLALFGVTMICEIGSYIYTFHTEFDDEIINYIPKIFGYEFDQSNYEPEYYEEPSSEYYDDQEYNYDDQYIEPKNEYTYESSDQYSNY